MIELPKWTLGIIGAACFSHKTDLVKLLRDYNSQQHPTELTVRDCTHDILAWLHLLPLSNTRKKAKLSYKRQFTVKYDTEKFSRSYRFDY